MDSALSRTVGRNWLCIVQDSGEKLTLHCPGQKGKIDSALSGTVGKNWCRVVRDSGENDSILSGTVGKLTQFSQGQYGNWLNSLRDSMEIDSVLSGTVVLSGTEEKLTPRCPGQYEHCLRAVQGRCMFTRFQCSQNLFIEETFEQMTIWYHRLVDLPRIHVFQVNFRFNSTVVVMGSVSTELKYCTLLKVSNRH